MFKNEVIAIFEDNQSAIKIAHTPENNKRLKQVSVRFNFVKEKIENGIIDVVYVKTEDNIADIFTKPLSKIKFEKFKEELGVMVL